MHWRHLVEKRNWSGPEIITIRFAGWISEVSMDMTRIGYPAGYLRFFGSELNLDIHF